MRRIVSNSDPVIQLPWKSANWFFLTHVCSDDGYNPHRGSMIKALRLIILIQAAATAVITPPVITTPSGSKAVEQSSSGTRAAAALVTSFDGLGLGFEGPQGSATFRNPSDNSLAVGPN